MERIRAIRANSGVVMGAKGSTTGFTVSTHWSFTLLRLSTSGFISSCFCFSCVFIVSFFSVRKGRKRSHTRVVISCESTFMRLNTDASSSTSGSSYVASGM